MNSKQILSIQKKIGVAQDGFWGPVSMQACKKYLRELNKYAGCYPSSRPQALKAFYGEAGDESQHAIIDVGKYDVRYDGKKTNRIRCHRLVAQSLTRIIARIAESHPDILRQYDGCFNNRLMRNGTATSLHAYAAAVDFCSETNGNSTHWPTAADMPFEVIEIFAAEGWCSAGAFWGRDAMHFQATQF